MSMIRTWSVPNLFPSLWKSLPGDLQRGAQIGKVAASNSPSRPDPSV